MTNIISLGGSLISLSSGINIEFIKSFRSLILQEIKKGKKFIIVVGGGYAARQVIEASGKIIKISNTNKDWLGIAATKLNAELLRQVFQLHTHNEIITNPLLTPNTNKPIIIVSGWKPGNSTDFVAATIAEKLNNNSLINLSNTDFVYDRDPKKYPEAKIIREIKWQDFQKLVSSKWTPGLNMPFDPIATKKCAKLKIKVAIIGGKDLNNLKNCLNNKKFNGTLIS